MSALPRFEACLVCDMVRPEAGGKIMILGFFGACPHVDVGVPHLDQPAVLTFLFSGGPGDGTFDASVAVVDQADDRVIASTASLPFTASPSSPTALAPTLLLTFGRAGAFSARLVIDGEERMRGDFGVTQRPSGAG